MRENTNKQYGLTQAQRRIWFMEIMNPGTSITMLSATYQITGEIDTKLLEQAAAEIVKTYDAFRIRIGGDLQNPTQWFEETENVQTRISHLEIGTTEQFYAWVKEVTEKPASVFDEHLYQFTMLHFANGQVWLNLTVNHIIADGLSVTALLHAVMEKYLELRKGISSSYQAPSYLDYISTEREYEQSQRYQKGKEYWLTKYNTLPETSGIKSVPPFSIGSESNKRSITLDASRYDRILAFSEQYQVSLYTLFLSAMYVLLYKLTDSTDVPVGTVFANRTSKKEKDTIGMFVSTVATRISLNPDGSVLSLIQTVSKENTADLRHQKYPYNQLIQDLREQHGRNDLSELFRTSLEYLPLKIVEYEEIKVRLEAHFARHEMDDLLLRFDHMLNEGHVILHASYRTGLFETTEIDRIMEQYVTVLDQFLETPELRVREISLLSDEERRRILDVFNPPVAALNEGIAFHRYVEKFARDIPDHPAVVYMDKKLTYGELNKRAELLASLLREQGVGRETITGIWAERSVELLVGVLAVWKAGGAYVPLDPDYPAERIEYMLSDSEASVLLTQRHLLEGTGGWLADDRLKLQAVYAMDDEQMYNGDTSAAVAFESADSAPQDLAYVIYTSGTTGRPKGVMIEHGSLMNTADAYRREYRLDQFPVRLLQLASFSFDVFVGDIARTLYNGGTMVIVPKDDRIDPNRLYGWIRDQNITVFESTPALILPFMQHIYEEGLDVSSMQLLITSSDACSVTDYRLLQERFGGQFRIINSYGVTEAAIDSSFYDEPLDKLPSLGHVPIGKAWLNARFYIVDAGLKPVPVGVPGELVIGGAGVARGYWNRPDLTAEKFADSPFVSGERLYRTGDLARWLEDGNVDFIGRIDYQVKIRGFRIELGEIETALLRFPGIKQAVVTDRTDEQGQKYLCGYVAGDVSLQLSDLLSQLKQELPVHMVPARLVSLDQLPLTPNGKIDRKALPEPTGEVEAGREHVAPRTTLETRLALIWQQVLGIARVGVQDDFFDLGGHSLRASTLVSKIRKELQVEVPLRDVFRYTTIEQLAQRIGGLKQQETYEITKAAEAEYYPVSSEQKRLYVLRQLDAAERSYNMSAALLLEGKLDRTRVEYAFRALIQRHETLRTGIEQVQGEFVQRIYDEVEFAVDYFQVSEREVDQVVEAYYHPFDLTKPPLLRIGLIEVAEDRHILLFDMHHIVSDGISTALLFDEFSRLYRGEELAPLRIQYKDYAVWQHSEAYGQLIQPQKEYWLEQLSGELPVLELPTDFPRPAVQSFDGRTVKFDIGKERTEKLKELAARTGTTLYMVLLSAYSILMHKYSGQEDLIVGTPIAGRTQEEVQPIVGMFINTLAIRSQPERSKPYLKYLEEMKEITLGAFEHQNYLFEDLVESLHIPRATGRNPLFDTFFSLQNTENEQIVIEGLEQSFYPLENRTSKFELLLDISELDGQLECRLEYATALYKQETAERFARHYDKLLETIATAPEGDIASLEMLTEQEIRELVRGFNDSEADYPRQQTIHGLFEEQAKLYPDNVAAVMNERQLSYHELNERSNRLARKLRETGVEADQLVAILAERSLDMVVGILAILKAGGAYVPVDPDYPEERIRFMIEDSGAPLLLIQKHLHEKTDFAGTRLELDDFVWVDKGADSAGALDASNLEPISGPGNLAYVIYTSGTTGKPKGTLIEHKNVVRLLFNDKNLFDFGSSDTWTLFHSFCFDFSVWEMYGALLNGGKLVIVPPLTAKNPAEFLALLSRERVTILNQTPTYFYQLLREVLADHPYDLRIRNVIFGGEALSPLLLKGFKTKYLETKLINMYGITETTVHVTYKEITWIEMEAAKSNIGKPIPTLSVYVLDENRRPVPIGVAGEMYVSGEGLARGYLNRPDLTAEKFVDSPFAEGEKLYRSGDLAAWLPDGNIEYLGRIDHQVKIRGYRIELDEIETQLLNVEGVEEAVVLSRQDNGGEKALVAYFVADRTLTVSEMRTSLAQGMPGYMIPSYFVQLERMPLTSNGKVDRKALPEPQGSLQTGVEYVAPRNLTESQLVKIWEEVLGNSGIGALDNFFELGGHSLRATNLVSKIRKEMNVEFPLRDVFRYMTVESMAGAIANLEESEHSSIPKAEEKAYYPVSSAQKRLYVLHQLDSLELNYNLPSALQLEGALNEAKVEDVLTTLMARHDMLRTGFEIMNGEPIQRIHPLVAFKVEKIQASEDQVAAILEGFIQPFDLTQPPLLRALLIELEKEKFLLALDMHHIASDGLSMDVLLREFVRLYNGGELPELRIQYKDYAVWQQSEEQRQRIKRQEEYWRGVFSSELPVLELPLDYSRPAIQQFDGQTLTFRLDAEKGEALKQLASDSGATLYMLLLAAYSVLLHKYAGQEDIVVGTPIAARSHADLQPIIGMFVNTLALRLGPTAELTFMDYLQEVKETTLGAYEHQDYPFEELVEALQVSRDLSRNPLFDTMFSLQKHESLDLTLEGLEWSLFDIEEKTAKFDLSLDIVEEGNELVCKIEYATSLFKQETMVRLAGHYEQLLASILAQPGAQISDLDMLTDSEKDNLLVGFDVSSSALAKQSATEDTGLEAEESWRESTFHELFEEQAERTPGALAVVYEDNKLTYAELNAKANRLAYVLRARGVKPEQVVGILAGRSAELLIGVLAVWKAGGAYVPLDPDYPAERIEYMLADSGASVLLTQTCLLEQAEAWRSDGALTLQTVLALDDATTYSLGAAETAVGLQALGEAGAEAEALVQVAMAAVETSATAEAEQNVQAADLASNPVNVNKPGDLAYVIYTSGTTGRPKGVAVEHRSLVNTAAGYRRDYRLDQFPIRLLQLASFSFDVFVGDIARALYNGGTMVIVPKEDRIDPTRLYGWIRDYAVTVFESTPALVVPFMEHVYAEGLDLSSMQLLITSSDACSVADYRTLQERFGSQFRIINSYGVTEAAIDSSFYDEPLEKLPKTGSVPIGKAWLNARFYIVDTNLKPVPIGVLGELVIGGVGVARGYLNRPDLTAEKFVDSPFTAGERLYRTGDLARWMPDGNVDFIGRIDNQVKIRGYRIELGEIEAAMKNVAEVRQALVIDRTDERGQKYLCGYIVVDSSFDLEGLVAHLDAVLPSHMVPSRIMRLDQLPLTPNGKIDRKALPVPEGSIRAEAAYTAPRTPAEKALALVWQSVLGVDQVGTMDNFFALGGDSIKALQVSSRLLQTGYKLVMKDLFHYPTISALSLRLQNAERTASQSEVTGEVILTPIQRWFFEQNPADVHHSNQAIMQFSKQGFDEKALRQAVGQLIVHHDALRAVYRQTENGYTAWNRGAGENEVLFDLEVVDFKGASDVKEAVEAKANDIQASIDLENGPLVKLGLFRCDDGDHLLIAIHHLVVDGVSWRILLEDFAAAYEQALQGQPIRLPLKTDSFQTWAKQLADHANGPAMESEREYWQHIEQMTYEPLPKDFEQGRSKLKDSGLVTVRWTADETEQLLKQAHRAYHTEMNDLLLTALGLSVQAWSSQERVLVNLEGHGREELLPDVDITRTVGWFTSQFPVVLKLGHAQALGHQVKQVKENLRRIPNKGIGYGIQRYLSAPRDGESFVLEPEISFNYLGQFDQDYESSGSQPSPFSPGSDSSPNAVMDYVLDINGMVSEGVLELTIRYGETQYQRETVERLGTLLQSSLREVISHCVSKERPELTPSDVLLQDMTVEELEQLSEHTAALGELENVYTLTPLQKGMLFHSLLDADSEAYFEQVTFDLYGSLNLEAFTRGLDTLVQRNEALRTNFITGWRDEPIQVVFRERKCEVYFEDIRLARDEHPEKTIADFVSADKANKFDLAQDSLMRVTVLRTGDESYHVIWSHHHILMDGWCMSFMIKEVFDTYFAFQEKRAPELPPVTSYSRYIEWLEAQDVVKASDYWSEYLAGYDQQTKLPQERTQLKQHAFEMAEIDVELSQGLTGQIERVARQQQVTLNTFMQTVWGLVLQIYNNSEDVVFGSVVSGRPAEIPGIESMIGLFINTIPVRIQGKAEETVADILRKTQDQALASGVYETFPLFEIQSLSEQKRDLINHIMVFENYPMEEQIEQVVGGGQEALKIANIQSPEQTNYDLDITVIPEEHILLRFTYNALTFREHDIRQIHGHFARALEQVAANPNVRVHELELLTAAEKEEIVGVFNPFQPEVAPVAAFHRLFEQQAERTPEEEAVVYENDRLTYTELNERANRLSATLRRSGISRETIVGILAERSVDLLVAVLAVWKAGGAYVPLDPDYPADRVRFMLEDSGAKVLLTQTLLRERAESWLGEEELALETVLYLDDETSYSEDRANAPMDFVQGSSMVSGLVSGELTGAVNDRNESHPNDVDVVGMDNFHEARPEDLAYVIYTSGTTGKPKGVMIEHRSLVNTAAGYRREYRLDQFPVRLLQLASFSFDVFVGDIARTLYNGGTMVIVPKDDRIDPSRLHYWIEREQVTIFESTPALIVPFMEYVHEQGLKLSGMELLITSSDSCSVADYRTLQERFGPSFRIINAYGVTEAAIDSSFYDEELAKLPQTGHVPIGKAWLNAKFYIVDAHLNPVPVGVLGELVIGGVGVARGYLNRPELTEEKFVDSPFTAGERLYRTGDLARWMEDGNVDFIGRIDNQAKIRGYRIETGEVEAKLLSVGGVKEAVVVVREDQEGQKALCAYYTVEKDLTAADLKRAISSELPGYMIPSYFVELEQLPLTPNGKIDRKALPAPEGGAGGGREYVAPRTELEVKLAAIWQEVLAREKKVGVTDNFFDLGGHSLRATTLVSKMHKELGAQFPLRDVFRYSTVEEMAVAMERLEIGSFTAIPVAEPSEYYPLSSAQKRLYILNQLEGGELSYNIPGAMLLEGQLNRQRFEEAFRGLVARHETLRTGFEMVEGEAVQRIYEEVTFQVEYVQISEEQAEETVRQFVRAFDLAKPPLLRVGIAELAPDRHILMFDTHHIVSDGVSMDVLIEEFVHLYSGEPLKPLRIQYKDYAVWQQSDDQKTQLAKQEAYWIDMFRGELPVLEMPTDYPRPAMQSYEGRTLQLFMNIEKSEGLKRLAAENGATLYMVLLAAYKVLLHKYSGQEDVVVGTPIAGRNHSDVQPLIGMFVNTLAIRSYPAASKTFLDYLKEIRETTLSAFEHQNYPFEELVDKVNVARDLRRHPLFDTMFALQNTENVEIQLPGLHLSTYASEEIVSKFDLSLDVTEIEDGLEYLFEYATALYKTETVEKLAAHYLQLLESILRNPSATIAELNLLTAEEKEQIVGAFNPAQPEEAPVAAFHRLFEKQAEHTPEAEAVVYENDRLTYAELNERTNRLAATLRGSGIGREEIVGILAERSVDLLVAVLAVWKAGGAYVPLDPDYPADRVRFMLEDSGAKVLLTQTLLRERAEAWVSEEELALATVLYLDDETSYSGERNNAPMDFGQGSSSALDPVNGKLTGAVNGGGESYPNDVDVVGMDSFHEARPEDLAYIIYTSGTTGKPKGVMIEHRSLVNTAAGYRREYRLDQFPVRLLQLASFSFDVFVGDIARTLYNGGSMVIVPKDDRIDPSRLHHWIEREQVTIFESTPALIVPFMEYVHEQGLELSDMELLITSSDSCSVADYRTLQERFGPSFRIINAYGVTEAAIDSSFYDEELEKLPQTGHVPIGKAWLNAKFYIVDAHLNPVPVGVLGELVIGGVGVARGYLNRPELTEEKFVDSPFVVGERLYRTGDLARWMEDGNVDFIGRIDNQAKIRGYRIETGEIESQLLRVVGIREAVVLVRSDANGQKALCAYYTTDIELTAADLKRAISSELPGYMIPSYFVELEHLPLTPNGKIDRKALPAPEEGASAGREYVAPRNDLETKLVSIWQDVLGSVTIGVTDNFFDLGGHSLRATTLVSKVHKELHVDLPLRDVFRYSTIEAMAEVISRLEQQEFLSIPVLDKREYYPLSSVQKRLYIQQQMEGAELSYNMSGMTVLVGRLEQNQFEAALKGLIARHEVLRTGFEMVDGEPVQRVYSDLEFAVEYTKATESETKSIADAFVRVFDLERPPLLRVGLVEWEAERHLLMLDIHHIVTDGMSMGIFIEELLRLYNGETLEPLRIQYKEFAAWQQSEPVKERLKRQEAYWLDMLEGELPTLELPTDFVRPAARSFEGDVLPFSIDKKMTDRLQRIADENGATLYMVLSAAYSILLSKYSGQEDFIVGTPVSGRTHADLEPLIGMFVNTLAIRHYPSGEKTFLAYLNEVKETMLGAYDHQDYPFEELVKKLQVPRDQSRNPVFDVMFALETKEDNVQSFGDIQIESYPETHAVSQFDLTLVISLLDEGMNGQFEYATKLFTRNLIDNFAQDLLVIITQIGEQPSVLLKDISLNDQSEQEQDELEAIDIIF
ncbi:non-ribosomal peptide synthase domain TIGR01720/amino acid adenylation domain-containing protein [Paenibacillus sp. CF095]|uniref:non-ribosomal peptide synthetase n=1 Tax=Paenibacillus sp. CF095 TaxID=1881033 RepID=UPI0008819763|nr:non-ribosomal peptide synthetase [Paenibacillus sp. CF095]SDD79109.1 non-ribosomal peptide synthase domain TIGR01720/amino acid adenylation domain-containing protein [Paenibacillus sp. CF095]